MMVENQTVVNGGALNNLFAFFDPSKQGFITAAQVQVLYGEIRFGGVSMPQVSWRLKILWYKSFIHFTIASRGNSTLQVPHSQDCKQASAIFTCLL